MPRYHDPLELFRAAVAALNARDWPAVVSLCDPVTLRVWKRDMVQRFMPRESAPQMTVEQYLQGMPDMPREVAEYQLEQLQKGPDLQAWMRETLPGVDDVEALQRMPEGQAFEAWLEGCSPHRAFERARDTGQIPPERLAELHDALGTFWKWKPIGVVENGARIAYILYTFSPENGAHTSREMTDWIAALNPDERELAEDYAWCEGSRPELQHCRRQTDGSWLLRADDDFFRLSNSGFYGFSEVHEPE